MKGRRIRHFGCKRDVGMLAKYGADAVQIPVIGP